MTTMNFSLASYSNYLIEENSNFFGFGMKVRPLRSTFFCVSDRVVFVAKITNASSTVYIMVGY